MSSESDKNRTFLDRVLRHPLTRRRFLQTSSAATGVAAGAGTLLKASPARADYAYGQNDPDAIETANGVDVRYTVCLGCHSKCGIRVRVKDDTVLKIDGNPWHPNCAETGERLDFSAVLETAKRTRATVCPKGQAGVEVMYNPFRIKQPLKRVGARGSGQWEAISWDQALTEIADKLRPYYQGYAAGNSINGQSALGTIANQVAYSPGRFQHGEKEFTDRLWKMGFGTANNRHDHTSICETSHHVAGDFIGEKKKHHFTADMLEAEYIIWIGMNPLEANFPGQTLAKRTALARNKGVKHVIVDPRHSRACAFAHRWLPIKPGGDTALALGIASAIITSGNHDVDFLEAANNQAALATTNWSGAAKDKQYNATDAAWLVVVGAATPDDEWLYHRHDGKYQLVDPVDGARKDLDRDPDAPAQWGKLEIEAGDADASPASDFGLSGVGEYVLDINGDGSLLLAPVFQLYKARVLAQTMDFYAGESGIDAETISAVAQELAAAGRKGVVASYRGPAKHTHGVNMVQAVDTLNHLLGNWDWKGGCIGGTGGHLHEDGSKVAGQLKLKSQASSKRSPSGPQITRVKTYFDSSLAAALGENPEGPTKRQWMPYAYNGNYQEIIPSIEDQYPYALKVLISYWNNIPYSAPAAREIAFRVLTDESKLPLHVNFDIEMGEMASLADYILPDASYFERWATPHNSPVLLSKFSGFRSPVAGYYATKVGPNGKNYWDSLAAGELDQWNYTIDWANDAGPFTVEDILLEVMRRVAGGDLNNVDAFGDNAYFESRDAMVAAGVSPAFRNSINTAWDWFHNMLVNWAIESGIDPSDTAAIKDMVQRIVERGGWFQDTAVDGTNEYHGDYVKNRMKLSSGGHSLHFFFEYRYPDSHADKPGKRYKDPYSQMYYDPLPLVQPALDAKGEPVEDGAAFPFACVTYKPMYHSQGRTDSLPALTMLEPENFVEMNSADARRVDLWNGDLVRVTSASNSAGVKGRVKVTERIRPGVIAISHSRGRWEINSRPYMLDGTSTGFDDRRGRGLNSNPIMRLDPKLKNVVLQDPVGGSASFYDTRVNVEKVLI